ncbi:MAG: substrate-binding domain-containing protein [Devosia sp.]
MKGIRRLAQHLDISIGTVSRALNGKPDVNEKTRQRVLAAAAELGYVANQAGRSLREGSTKAIGFTIESGTDAAGNGDNFFFGVIDGVQTVFGRHHLDLVVLPCPTEEDPSQYVGRMVARGMVDGMIISATHRRDARIELLANARLPFIALGRSGTVGPHPWIDLDFEGVINRSVDRLVAKGHRRIAIGLPGNDVNLGFVFLDGYRAALVRHGLPFDPSLVIRAGSSEQGGYQIAHEMLALPDRPTAVVLIYEMMAIGLYRRLNEAGLRPGHDIAVVGFREGPQSRFLSPSLTCFRLSLRDLGVALGEALLASMPAYADIYPQGLVRRIWPLELIPGDSDGPARG